MNDGNTAEWRRAQLDAWWQQEPLGFETTETHRSSGGRQPFEFSSRGDRVEGWLRTPGRDERPLIVGVCGSTTAAADSLVAAWEHTWVERGAAVAFIDLPLHGARESAKLTAALVDAASDLGRLERDSDRKRLVVEFLRQCRWDLRGAVAGLREHPQIASGRVACFATGLAALGCLHACRGLEIRAAVLLDTPAGGPPDLDASGALAGLECPALLLDSGSAGALAGGTQQLSVASLEEAAERAWPFLAGAFDL